MHNTTTYNIAFFDSEFTAKSATDRGVQEMIQCAFLVHTITLSEDAKIVNVSNHPIYIYNQFVQPTYNKSLSAYIKSLTGITQDDVDGGVNICVALGEINKAIRKYGIKHIITWGPDRILLRDNCEIIDFKTRDAKNIYCKFKDVSERISKYFDFQYTASQHKICEMLNIKEDGHQHNAYYDALNLAKIMQSFIGKNANEIYL
jgi:inhibitor of KinA sporulation pathway (predicted exonuclease)